MSDPLPRMIAHLCILQILLDSPAHRRRRNLILTATHDNRLRLDIFPHGITCVRQTETRQRIPLGVLAAQQLPAQRHDCCVLLERVRCEGVANDRVGNRGHAPGAHSLGTRFGAVFAGLRRCFDWPVENEVRDEVGVLGGERKGD